MIKVGDIVKLKNWEKGLGRIYSKDKEDGKFLVNWQFYNDNYKKVIFMNESWFDEDELEKTDISFKDFCFDYCVFNDRNHYNSCCGVYTKCDGKSKRICLFNTYKEEYPFYITYSDDEIQFWCKYCEKHFKKKSFDRFKKWVNNLERENYKFELYLNCPYCNKNNFYELHKSRFLLVKVIK